MFMVSEHSLVRSVQADMTEQKELVFLLFSQSPYIVDYG